MKPSTKIPPTDERKSATDAMTAADLVALANGDPILLLEAAAQAAGADRYKRNSALQTLTRGFAAAAPEIRAWQKRIDDRNAEREAEKARA